MRFKFPWWGNNVQQEMVQVRQPQILTDIFLGNPSQAWSPGPGSPFPGHFGYAETMGRDSSYQNTYQILSPGGSVTGTTTRDKQPLYTDLIDPMVLTGLRGG